MKPSGGVVSGVAPPLAVGEGRGEGRGEDRRPEIPGFVLEDRVGEGSGGVVWRGRAADGVGVAIKVAVADTLAHEIAVLARAQRRWGPALLAHGMVEGRAWMASTWVEGVALAPGEHGGDEAAAVVAHGVARGLDELHRAGFRHGDVKPANILVNGRRPRVDRASERGATLVDLDLAAAADVGALVGGTPAYLPPEASGAGEMSPAADLYALGLVLREMKPSGVPALWVEALLARAPGARPSAAFIAAQAARFLGLSHDEEEVVAERRARVRRTYLALRPLDSALPAPAAPALPASAAPALPAPAAPAHHDIDPSIVAPARGWLESAGLGARPLTRLETARWIVALVGPDAAHWSFSAHEGESVLAGRLLDLAAKAAPEAWTREEVAGTARAGRAPRATRESGPALWVELAAALGAPRPEEAVLARVEEELAAAADAHAGAGAVAGAAAAAAAVAGAAAGAAAVASGTASNTARIQDPPLFPSNLNSSNNASDGGPSSSRRLRDGDRPSDRAVVSEARAGVSGPGAADPCEREEGPEAGARAGALGASEAGAIAGALGASKAGAIAGAPGTSDARAVVGASGASEAVAVAGAPGASEAVAVAGAPGASEAVAVAGAPGASDARAVVGTPGASEAVAVAGAPGASDARAVVGAPGASDARAVAGAPGASKAGAVAGAPGASEAGAVAGAPGASEAGAVAGAPGASDARAVAGAPGASKAGAVAGAPGASDARAVVGAPGASEAGAVAGAPGASDARAVVGAPGASDARAVAGAPGASEAGAVAGAPGASDARAVVGAPGASDARAVVGAPGASDARAVAGAPAALATELAAALLRRGAVGRAFAAVAHARDEEATLLRAEIARRRGDGEGAAGYAEAALKAAGTRERAHALLARLAWDRGDLARAESEAEAASGAGGAEVQALIAYAKGEHVRGLALLADVDASGLARARLDGTRGMLEHARGDARASVDAFQRAVDRATEAGALIEEATYLTGLAAAAVDAGATASALASSTRAALLWERLGREAMAARAHMNRAAAFALVGAAHEAAEAAAEVRNDARAKSYARWAIVESRQPGDALAAEQARLAYAELADADPEDAVRALARVLVYAPAAAVLSGNSNSGNPSTGGAVGPAAAREGARGIASGAVGLAAEIQDPAFFSANLNSGNNANAASVAPAPAPGPEPAFFSGNLNSGNNANGASVVVAPAPAPAPGPEPAPAPASSRGVASGAVGLAAGIQDSALFSGNLNSGNNASDGSAVVAPAPAPALGPEPAFFSGNLNSGNNANGASPEPAPAPAPAPAPGPEPAFFSGNLNSGNNANGASVEPAPAPAPGPQPAFFSSNLNSGNNANDGSAVVAPARALGAAPEPALAPASAPPDLAAVDARVNAMAAATRWEWWGARAATVREPRFVAEIVALLDVPAPIGSRGPALAAAVKLARAIGDGEAARRIEAVRRAAATTLREGAPPEHRASLSSIAWLDGIAEDDERTALGAGQVGELEAIVRALSSRDRLKPLLEQVLDTMVLWTGVERGLLLLRAPDGKLVPRAARNLARRDLGHEQLTLSTGLAQRAIAERRTVLATDAFAQVGDLHASVHALGLRSVLAVPLVARGDVLGVVYLDDRVRRNAFGPGELAWVRLVASQAALAIADARDQALLRRAVRRAERANARLAAELGQREVELATARAETRFRYDDIVGRSEPMRQMLKLVDRVTMSDVPVLLVGESGTGKELVARAIHANGLRSTRPFVSENCGSVPETLLESTLFGHVRGAFTGASATRAGLFDVADRGSLFLDEIGEMPLAMQTKLLRVLQNGEVRPVGGERSRTVDVRIIGATHRDLDAMVAAGTFREDLFYRLNVVSIRIPPLRERREDIPLLANRFVTQHAEPGRKTKLTRAAIDRLAAFPWPGNVRQLENEIRRALVLADDRIDVTELSDEVAKGGPSATRDAGVGLKARIDALETDLVKDALLKTKGNQTRAAELLGISRFGLQKMMKRLGVRSP